jgi:hypothetical protein
MARPTSSSIDATTVDEQYPVAGVDNDSQGFRDNFGGIKDSLTAAKSEIEDLMDNTARLDVDNDFNGNDIQEANFIKCTEEVHNNGNLTASQNISFANGHYQTIGAGADITLTLADWPESGKLGKMRLVVKGDGTARTIVWSTEGGGTIKYGPGFPSPFTITSTTDPKIIDVWTDDGGLAVYAHYVGEFD